MEESTFAKRVNVITPPGEGQPQWRSKRCSLHPLPMVTTLYLLLHGIPFPETPSGRQRGKAMKYRITMRSRTTTGEAEVTTDPIDSWGEAMDHLAGMVAAVGEHNVHAANIYQSLELDGALMRLKMIRDDSTCPMNIAADIDQVLVEDFDVRDDD